MLQIVPQLKTFLAVAPADFRKGIDGLAALCKHKLSEDPFSGSLFLFINKRNTAVQILVYDGQGFWLCLKRLSRGKFRYWPNEKERSSVSMKVSEVQALLYNGNPQNINSQEEWRKVS